MPVSPFEGDVDPRPSGDRRHEERDEAAVRPEMRASPADDSKDTRAEETIEEPGYGHGV